MNYKRKKGKQARAGCLTCKPHKLPANKHSDKQKAKQFWQQQERAAYDDA